MRPRLATKRPVGSIRPPLPGVGRRRGAGRATSGSSGSSGGRHEGEGPGDHGSYPHNTIRLPTRFGGEQFVAPLPHLGLPPRFLAASSLPSPRSPSALRTRANRSPLYLDPVSLLLILLLRCVLWVFGQ